MRVNLTRKRRLQKPRAKGICLDAAATYRRAPALYVHQVPQSPRHAFLHRLIKHHPRLDCKFKL